MWRQQLLRRFHRQTHSNTHACVCTRRTPKDHHAGMAPMKVLAHKKQSELQCKFEMKAVFFRCDVRLSTFLENCMLCHTHPLYASHHAAGPHLDRNVRVCALLRMFRQCVLTIHACVSCVHVTDKWQRDRQTSVCEGTCVCAAHRAKSRDLSSPWIHGNWMVMPPWFDSSFTYIHKGIHTRCRPPLPSSLPPHPQTCPDQLSGAVKAERKPDWWSLPLTGGWLVCVVCIYVCVGQRGVQSVTSICGCADSERG